MRKVVFALQALNKNATMQGIKAYNQNLKNHGGTTLLASTCCQARVPSIRVGNLARRRTTSPRTP